MDREKGRLNDIFDYNKKPRSGNAVKSIDPQLFFVWNKKLRKWTLRQNVPGRIHTVGHYNSESEGIRDARRLKSIKNNLRPGQIDRDTAYVEQKLEEEREAILKEVSDDEVERAFYDGGCQQAKPMVSFGG